LTETGLINNNPKHELTENDARKGGIKSGETRRRRKALKEELIALLEMNDTQEKISLALIDKALGGDVSAFTTIRDTIGEKPADKAEVEIGNKIKVDVVDE
jgi:hypothetical protein